MPHIQLKLYASLQMFAPPEGEEYPIAPGMTVQDLLAQIHLPAEKAKLIFIDGTKAELSSRLEGGERVGTLSARGGRLNAATPRRTSLQTEEMDIRHTAHYWASWKTTHGNNRNIVSHT